MLKINQQPEVSSLISQLDFLSLIDTLPHGMLLMDTSHRVIAINRFLEALTGYAREEVHGVRGEYVIRSNFDRRNDPVAAALSTNEIVTLEGDIINLNRKKIPVRFTISPFRFMTGTVAGVLIILEDISLLKDLDDKIHGFPGREKIIGHSRKMLEIFDLLPIVARTDASALITGETGTGKDLVAEAIHHSSKRSRRPFIKINCGALPESLLESELFGHVRGAFTGAQKDKPGMFRLAHGGTLFLTEIGDLPLPLQVKLLTVLDDKEFFPLGGSQKVRVDVRIIAATHRNLTDFVRQGKFREDLFYRLNVLRLHLPALREREGDLRLLLDHFLRQFNASLNKKIKNFNRETLAILLDYAYPGNIRELRNIVEYAANICQEVSILPSHLPGYILDKSPSLPKEDHFRGPEDKVLEKTASTSQEAGASSTSSGWDEMEKKMIIEALVKTGGKRSKAARLLGWGRSTLWRKIHRHGLA